MYQAWPWGGTTAAATASPTTAAFAQPAAAGQVASATQWPAGYSQYAVTPEVQQQWAAWASQQQYAAYTGALPVGQTPTATSYATGYAGYETAPNSSTDSTAVDKSSQSANEKSKNPAEELVAKDTSELEKLNKLKEQAEQWKTLQQPAAATWPYSTGTAASVNTTAVTTDATLNSNAQPSVAESGTTQIDKENEEFERQFKDWEKQFDAWKRENSNHPDKEAFARYEVQWQEWRTQLLQKKEQMQKAKASKITAQPAADVTVAPPTVPQAIVTPVIPPVAMTTVTGVDLNNQTNVTTLADPATAAAPTMFYPPNQYMYMQPYVYPGSVPAAQTSIPPPPFAGQSIPPNFGASTPSNQPLSNDQNASMPMNFNDPNMNMKGAQSFDQNRDGYNYNQRTNENNADEFQNYEGYENSNMFPQEMEDYQREMKFGRGGRGGRGARGVRGRGRARGRGGQSRWSDGPEMEQQPSGSRGQSLLPTPPSKFSTSAHDGRPPLLDSVPPFDDGQPPFDDGQPPFGGRQPPFDMRPPFGGRQPFDDRQPPFDKRPPIFEGEPPNFESGQAPFEGGLPPFNSEQPHFEDGPPPYEYPPDDMGDFNPDQRSRQFPLDDKTALRQDFKSEDRFLSQKGLQPYPPDEFNEPFSNNPYDDRYPPGKDRFQSENEEFPIENDRFQVKGSRFPTDGDRFPSENERFPCEDERFPPGPGRFQGGPDRFPHGPDRRPPGPEAFPPGPDDFPPGPMDDHFMGGRDFDQYPPDNNMYGPPPFREEFPLFEDRYPPKRGRFSGRGRRMPRGEFDRFGPPFQPGMGDEGFGPDFPPADRFGFPGDGPPRMPRGRGMRSNFDPGFPGRGRFPDDRFYGDGPPGRGGKTIDYTHRPASAVMGEDYNPHYDFESDFQSDVVQYRAAPSKRIKRAPNVEKKKDA